MAQRSLEFGSTALLALLLLGTATGFAAPTMQIQASLVKSSLLVGEPLVLIVTVKTNGQIRLERDLTEASDPLNVLVDRGGGFVPYRQKAWASVWRDPGRGRPEGDQITLEYTLAYDDNLKDWIFPSPGTYRLVVEYRDGDFGPFRSNVITLTAQAPTGDEKTVHDSLRALGPAILGIHQSSRLGPLKQLLDRFPASAYLQEPRLNDLNARMGDVASGYEPGQIREAGTPENPPKRPDLRSEVVRERLTGLIPDAEAAAQVSGPFQPEALLILAGLYDATGNEEAARATYQRIVEDFSDREAARLALEEVGDTTPPTIELAASPSSLWPPNHKIEAIAITVTVADNMDQSPAVKLVSIGCDDGCAPASDIAGAAYGTDDRAVGLRSERKGFGSGRTYTITYEASDASGNKATATTTVTVPHDQGVAKQK